MNDTVLPLARGGYHRLAGRHLQPLGLLMRALLNSGTLAPDHSPQYFMSHRNAADLVAARRSLEGTFARWFALDSEMHIGVLTGPWAAWPAPVFDDVPAIFAADDFLADDPQNTDGLRVAEVEAWQGLFSFSADPGYGGQSEYVLDAAPARPLAYDDAPPAVRRAAALLRSRRSASLL